MYKGTQEGRDYLSRTGSHSTKPKRDLSGCGEFGHPELSQIQRMELAEAREQQQRLKERFRIVFETAPKSKERQRLELTLGHIKRRIGYLQQIADAADDYGTLMRALREVCGDMVAEKVLAKKLQMQQDFGEAVAAPKSDGRPRKPVHLRNGNSLEQQVAKNRTPAA